MKKTIAIILGFLLVLAGFAGVWTQQINNKKTESRPEIDSPVDISKLCVTVSCGEYYGCGTIYDSDESSFTIVTARHVLDEYFAGSSDSIEVTFDDQSCCAATIISDTPSLDIAFLNIDADAVSESYYSVSDISPGSDANVSEANIIPASGQTIYFADANTGDVYAGSIISPSVYSEDFGMDMIYCYCAVTSGMSGTGLFDESGNYLGILLGGSDEAEAVCLDASSVRDAYSKSEPSEYSADHLGN